MRALACIILTLALAGCGGGPYNDSDTAMLLMGATAFSNGYNNARPGPMVMCQHVGMMTLCQ